MGLTELRKNINDIDDEIVKLFANGRTPNSASPLSTAWKTSSKFS